MGSGQAAWLTGRTEAERTAGYLDPETGLLATKSLAPLASAQDLRDFEDDAVENRLIGLTLDPVVGDFDLSHLRRIHFELFQDIYDWAGELRTIGTAKGIDPVSGGPARFASVDAIETTMREAHVQLRQDDFLRGRDAAAFADALARPFNLVNLAHPFREGNGRTQRAFWDQLAAESGHELAWSTYSGTEHAAVAMQARTTGDLSDLRRMLRRIVS